MPELVFLKLGGSLITDKRQPFTAREEVIIRLAREIRQAQEARDDDLQLVIGHGSGSFGHVVAKKYRTTEGDIAPDSWVGFAEVSAAAARLNRIVTDLMLQERLPVVSFQPSASARMRKSQLMYFDTHPIREVLKHGLIPMIYGDVAVDAVQGVNIASTEQLFDSLARELNPSRIILAGVVDGVYDADPLSDSQAERIDVIDESNWDEIAATLGGSHATDVTGGMLTKVRDIHHLVLAMPPMQALVISGEIRGRVASSLMGHTSGFGTVI